MHRQAPEFLDPGFLNVRIITTEVAVVIVNYSTLIGEILSWRIGFLSYYRNTGTWVALRVARHLLGTSGSRSPARADSLGH